jgi:hypothetical protein
VTCANSAVAHNSHRRGLEKRRIQYSGLGPVTPSRRSGGRLPGRSHLPFRRQTRSLACDATWRTRSRSSGAAAYTRCSSRSSAADLHSIAARETTYKRCRFAVHPEGRRRLAERRQSPPPGDEDPFYRQRRCAWTLPRTRLSVICSPAVNCDVLEAVYGAGSMSAEVRTTEGARRRPRKTHPSRL